MSNAKLGDMVVITGYVENPNLVKDEVAIGDIFTIHQDNPTGLLICGWRIERFTYRVVNNVSNVTRRLYA